jgi:thymidylate synthase
MKIIKNDVENLIIINKSKFIGIVKKVYTLDEVNDLLDKTKEKYSDATHVCYAYILPNKEKYDDDGEPMGTAGIPILDILKKNDLTYIIAIVVRYFGGIKLGSNGLVRAYSNTISSLIKDNIKEIETGYLIKIEESYSNSDKLDYILKNSEIIKKDYQDKINILVLVNKKTLDDLSNVNYEIIEERII